MVYILILFGALFRIFSNASGFDFFPPNFAPIGALALFGGYFLPRKQGLIIPMIAMLLSDLVIGFYEPLIMASVYLSFALINIFGQILGRYKNNAFTLGGVVLSSFLFFFITNAAVWLDPGSTYPNGLSGLVASLGAGIPFLKFTLVGDLVFYGLFFGVYELCKGLKVSERYLLS